MSSNGETVEQVARELIDRHGPDALRITHERADLARELGDEPSAAAWHDIAAAIEHLLRRKEALVIRT